MTQSNGFLRMSNSLKSIKIKDSLSKDRKMLKNQDYLKEL